MTNIPDDLTYTAEHEYLRPTGDAGVFEVGITDFAQGELGDIVFVNLPAVGDTFAANGSFGTVEAVKAVSDLYCPVAGEIVAINDALDADPAVINKDPYGAGWMIRLRADNPADASGLLDAAAYRAHIGA